MVALEAGYRRGQEFLPSGGSFLRHRAERARQTETGSRSCDSPNGSEGMGRKRQGLGQP